MFVTFAIAFITVLGLDLLSKQLVLQHIGYGARIVLLPGVLSLTHVRNAGAAFGLFAGQRTLFFAAAIVVTITLFVFRSDILASGVLGVLASGLIMGGTIGNLIDRLRFDGHVVDFISFSFFRPVFNVADSALVVGAILLGGLLLRAELNA
jgi:signal peptidase II